MKVKIAICDDNVDYQLIIEKYLNDLEVKHLEYDFFMSGEELIATYKNHGGIYDVIFLDMEMKNLNGIETANIIRQTDRTVIIVFVTSYKSYMEQSFECAPFRYLIKPVEFPRFKKTWAEICAKIAENPDTVIFFEDKKRTRVYSKDVVCFESVSHWIIMTMCNRKKHKIRKSMNALMESVNAGIFVRTNRAYAVNLSHIHKICENKIIMNNIDIEIPLSKTYRQELIEAFHNYRERKYLL